MDNFVQYRQIYSDEYLAKIAEYTLHDAAWVETDAGVRLVSNLKEDPDAGFLVDEYMGKLNEIEKEVYSSMILRSGGYTGDSKVSKYEVGGEFDWHLDSTRKSSTNSNWTRMLTTITYLNDDYTGGETEIHGGLTITPKKNHTLCFPSGIPYIHRGKPVIEGTKYLLVTHVWT